MQAIIGPVWSSGLDSVPPSVPAAPAPASDGGGGAAPEAPGEAAPPAAPAQQPLEGSFIEGDDGQRIPLTPEAQKLFNREYKKNKELEERIQAYEQAMEELQPRPGPAPAAPPLATPPAPDGIQFPPHIQAVLEQTADRGRFLQDFVQTMIDHSFGQQVKPLSEKFGQFEQGLTQARGQYESHQKATNMAKQIDGIGEALVGELEVAKTFEPLIARKVCEDAFQGILPMLQDPKFDNLPDGLKMHRIKQELRLKMEAAFKAWRPYAKGAGSAKPPAPGTPAAAGGGATPIGEPDHLREDFRKGKINSTELLHARLKNARSKGGGG